MIALLEAKAAGLWSRKHLANNLLAGMVVGIVALPLAMAFAIASGVRPEQGLYTAIVGVPSFLLPKVTVGFADNHRVRIGFS